MLVFAASSCQREIADIIEPDIIDDDNPDTNCVNNINFVKDGHEIVYVCLPPTPIADSLYTVYNETAPGIFTVTQTFDDGEFFDPVNVFVKPCDKIFYQAQEPDLSDLQLTYDLNGELGDSWVQTTTSQLGYTITNTSTIEEVDISVTVPAGTFNCMRIRTLSEYSVSGFPDLTNDTYLSADYGPVKIIGETAHYEMVRTNF